MKPVQIGDIFYCSWGYDQTNVDFMQVTHVSPTGKTCTLKMIQAEPVPGSEGFMSCQTRPKPDQLLEGPWANHCNAWLRKKLVQISDDKPYIRTAHGYARRIDNLENFSTYNSWYA